MTEHDDTIIAHFLAAMPPVQAMRAAISIATDLTAALVKQCPHRSREEMEHIACEATGNGLAYAAELRSQA